MQNQMKGGRRAVIALLHNGRWEVDQISENARPIPSEIAYYGFASIPNCTYCTANLVELGENLRQDR
jgi:hypothetical protein